MTPLTVLLIGSLYPPDEKDFRISGLPGLGASTPELAEAADKRAQARFEEATKAYNEKQKPQFEAACQALGAAFARKHWRIMVGVPLWEQWDKRQTVVPFVLAGANSEKPDEATGRHPIIFYAPREPEEPTQDGPAGTLEQLEVSHPNVKLEYKLIAHGQYKAKIIPNLDAVDAVVLVAGKDGTATIGYAAHCLERPVLAVAGFGGTARTAARTLLDDVLFDAYDRYKGSVELTDGELLSLTAAWNNKADDAANRATAENVVSAAEKLVKAYALADRKTTRVLKGAMAGMALLLVLWVTIFLRGATVALETPVPATNAAIASAATASAKPAVVVTSKDDATNTAAATAEPVPLDPSKADSKPGAVAKSEDATAKAAMDDASSSKGKTPPPPKAGMIPFIPFVQVAFFLLLYISTAVGTGLRVLVAFQSNQLTRLTGFAVGVELVVALSVAFGLALFYLIGSISFTGQVSMLASNAQNFPMVAVSMSLLGLTAGYLVPLDKLRDRLQKTFAEEKK
jgi:hypothetical protein